MKKSKEEFKEGILRNFVYVPATLVIAVFLGILVMSLGYVIVMNGFDLFIVSLEQAGNYGESLFSQLDKLRIFK